MHILEQKHKNLRRIYYHGFHKNKEDRICEDFYLTTSFAYAAINAGPEGTVTEYFLTKENDIFNALSKQDYTLIQKYCEKHATKYLKTLPRLKNEDWYKVFDKDLKKRQSFINNVIKVLKFDGYFNFEIDKKLQIELDKQSLVFIPKLTDCPSIAIFDESCLLEGQTFCGKKDFVKNKQVQEAREMQLDFLAYRMLELYDEDRYTVENIRKLYYSFVNILFFTLDELYVLTKNWKLEDLFKDKEKFVKEFAFLKEDMTRPIPITFKKRGILLAENIFNSPLTALYL